MRAELGTTQISTASGYRVSEKEADIKSSVLKKMLHKFVQLQ